MQPRFVNALKPSTSGLGERLAIPLKVLVPAGGRGQSALEGADGAPDVLERDGILRSGKGGRKRAHVFGNRLQHSNHRSLVRHRHLEGVQDRAPRLLFDRRRPAVPELRGEAGGVVDGGRIPSSALPTMPLRRDLVVRAVLVELVAAVARKVVIFESRVSK